MKKPLDSFYALHAIHEQRYGNASMTRTVRLFTSQALAVGESVRLEAGPARHLVKVLRRRAGEPVRLFCGDGFEYAGTLTEVCTPDHCVVQLESATRPAVESPLAITLVQAVSRGERMDWSIQKACELGVATIQPVFTERTEVRLSGDRADKRRRHWHGVAIAACEQSGRCRVPEIAAPVQLTELELEVSPRLFLDPQADRSVANLKPPGTGQTMIAIGPEGGFTGAEITWLQRQGFVGLRLGPRVLRTETAGPAAIAILQSRFGDLT